MPRSRNIKPGLCQNDKLAECSIPARYLAALIPCFADRSGRLEDRPLKLKIGVFPVDDGIDVTALLDELEGAGYIHRYEAKKTKYIQIVKFSKHQSPHVNEVGSTIPAPEQHRTSTVQSITKDKCAQADSCFLIPDVLIPDSLKKDGAVAPESMWEIGEKSGIPRAVIGKACKSHTETAVANAIAAVVQKRPADPKAFFLGLLRENPTNGAKPAWSRIPYDDDDLVPFAVQHGFYKSANTGAKTYKQIRAELGSLVTRRLDQEGLT